MPFKKNIGNILVSGIATEMQLILLEVEMIEDLTTLYIVVSVLSLCRSISPTQNSYNCLRHRYIDPLRAHSISVKTDKTAEPPKIPLTSGVFIF